MNFEQTIQEWVLLDDQIKIYYKKVKELRDKRDNIEGKLTQYALINNLTNSTIKTSDGKVKFVNTKTTSPLTFKYLEKSLGEIIKNSEQVTAILNHIKNNREHKVEHELKRYYNN
jgi:DNA-binding Xre family transcriptional regulator